MENFGISSHSIERSKTVQLTIRRINALRCTIVSQACSGYFWTDLSAENFAILLFSLEWESSWEGKKCISNGQADRKGWGGSAPWFHRSNFLVHFWIIWFIFQTDWTIQNMPTWQITNHWPQKGEWEVKFMCFLHRPLSWQMFCTMMHSGFEPVLAIFGPCSLPYIWTHPQTPGYTIKGVEGLKILKEDSKECFLEKVIKENY